MSQDDLGVAIGVSRSAISKWERGILRPRLKAMTKLAEVTKKPLLWLESGVGDSGPGLMVVGRVAAGVWKEGNAERPSFPVPVAPHPSYPSGAQRLYQVEGTSINRLAIEGEYLHAVDIQEAGLRPEDGDLVIVRRMEHGLAEYTAKILSIRSGKFVLKPDSDDPEWQTEMVVTADDGTEVEIIDVVIAKWSPLGRRIRA